MESLARSSSRAPFVAASRMDLIGESKAIVELRREIAAVAPSDAKVLITGESGVGKEVVARAIHMASSRWDRAFVPVNCAGMAETLLESELFGHVRGSFTGAYRDKQGKLETATHGTIFLDEVGEMSPRMQGLLLRFLETGEIQKVGAERLGAAVNVRVIAATNADLRHLIAQGQFREDLFYRLNVIYFAVPPLRKRKEDIPVLIEHFLERHSSRSADDRSFGNGRENSCIGERGVRSLVRGISPEAVCALREYAWPGNVRELENVVERLVVTVRREVIELDDLGPEIRTQFVNGTQASEEPRAGVADELFRKLTKEGESFWTTVYPPFMNREITRSSVRELVGKGLVEARGNYKVLARMFNMEQRDYKRFLCFLRTHECRLPPLQYR